MASSTIGKTSLSLAGPGSPCSYELQGDCIVERLFGIFAISHIHLSAVYYLRLATKSEVPPAYLLFNWIQFLPHRRSVRPVYVLQTRSRHRIFLKLDGATHFKLRQAIGRHNGRGKRIAA